MLASELQKLSWEIFDFNWLIFFVDLLNVPLLRLGEGSGGSLSRLLWDCAACRTGTSRGIGASVAVVGGLASLHAIIPPCLTISLCYRFNTSLASLHECLIVSAL